MSYLDALQTEILICKYHLLRKYLDFSKNSPFCDCQNVMNF